MKEILDNKEVGLKLLAEAEIEVDKATAVRDEIAERFGLPLELGHDVMYFPEKWAEVRNFMEEHCIYYEQEDEYYELDPSKEDQAIIEAFTYEFEEFLWRENMGSGYWSPSNC